MAKQKKRKELPTKPVATKIADVSKYNAQVAVYTLTIPMKHRKLDVSRVAIAYYKPKSGTNNTSIWPANFKNEISSIEPIMNFYSRGIEDALKKLGYVIVNG